MSTEAIQPVVSLKKPLTERLDILESKLSEQNEADPDENSRESEGEISVGALRSKWKTKLDEETNDFGPEMASTIKETEANIEKQKTVRHAISWHHIGQIAKRAAQSWKMWVIQTIIVSIIPPLTPLLEKIMNIL